MAQQTRSETSKRGSRKRTVKTAGAPAVSDEMRHRMIAEAAYYLAERRNFVGQDATQDWLAAEHEIDRMLTRH